MRMRHMQSKHRTAPLATCYTGKPNLIYFFYFVSILVLSRKCTLYGLHSRASRQKKKRLRCDGLECYDYTKLLAIMDDSNPVP
jgi:hypothetical protein